MAKKRLSRQENRRVRAKPKSRAASLPRRASKRKPLDPQQHAFRVFEKQADSLWSRLTTHCREFAEAFNQAVGEPVLLVQAEPFTLRVTYPRAEVELCFQLDRSERFLRVSVEDTVCPPNCSTCEEPLPVGLTVNGDQLKFVLSGEVMSDEQVAVTLLTQLTNGTLVPSSQAPAHVQPWFA